MKQEITIEQWNELSEDEKLSFYDCTSTKTAWNGEATIGDLIEFLGEDLQGINQESIMTDNGYKPIGWTVITKNQRIGKAELRDALWEATKHKLKYAS